MKLLTFVGLAAAFAFAQVGEAATIWTSCNQCTLAQRQQTALSLTLPNTYQYIYVVDNTRREVSKFETFSEVEPGQQNTQATVLPTESAVLTASRDIWSATDTLNNGVQLPQLPSCEAGGREGAANYVGNDLNCQQAVANTIENGSVFAQIRRGFSVALNSASAYYGTQRQFMAVVRFGDGSKLKLQVTLGQDINTGQVSVLKVKPVEATNAFGDPLPVSSSQAQNFTVTTRPSGAGDLLFLLSDRWGFMIARRICSHTQGGASCQPQGGQIVCEVRGTVGC